MSKAYRTLIGTAVGGRGDGTFADDVLYGAGDGPFSVAIGDLDGDGDLDVADGLINSVSVLLNGCIP